MAHQKVDAASWYSTALLRAPAAGCISCISDCRSGCSFTMGMYVEKSVRKVARKLFSIVPASPVAGLHENLARLSCTHRGLDFAALWSTRCCRETALLSGAAALLAVSASR
eukprot:17917-Heterococcus_DN1.PRE.1